MPPKKPYDAAFWKLNIKLVGWLPTLLTLLTIAGGLALTVGRTAQPWLRVVEILLPLALGWQAALLISTEFEPPLELLLTYPRSLAQVLIDRLLVVLALGCGVAVCGYLLALLFPLQEPFFNALLRWLPPAFFLIGAGLFVTQATRQAAYGAILVTLLWAGLLFGGDALLARWPSLWPLHLYLQPQNASAGLYLANRAALILAGFGMILLALSVTRDEERVLGLKGGSS